MKKQTKPQARLTDAQIAAGLRAQRGNISATAEALGVDRRTIYRRVTDNTELEAIWKEARESLIDVAESALLKLINEGNVAAIIFALKTQGRARGYSERLELTGADGGAIKVKAFIGVSPDDWDENDTDGGAA